MPLHVTAAGDIIDKFRVPAVHLLFHTKLLCFAIVVLVLSLIFQRDPAMKRVEIDRLLSLYKTALNQHIKVNVVHPHLRRQKLRQNLVSRHRPHTVRDSRSFPVHTFPQNPHQIVRFIPF